jgi:hypothetical protein
MKEIAAVTGIDYSFGGWKELLNTGYLEKSLFHPNPALRIKI